MKKWTRVAEAYTPDGNAITLNEHDGSYSIRVDNIELMSTRRHASEETAADLVCARIAKQPAARLLIGGLGFGFTLRAALKALPSTASVTVAEIIPAVIDWNRNPAFPLAGDALADPRVTVLPLDAADLIRNSSAAFDGIVLDTDNGPAALTAETNSRLYDAAGLHAARAALRPGGCIAYWSASPAPAFEKSLARAGLDVEVHRARAWKNSGSVHTIFLALMKS